MESSTIRPSQASHPVDRAANAAIVFDGDDTLWETESLYDHARSAAAQVVASEGYDPEAFEELQRVIDTRNVESMGLSAERFPASSVEAFEELCRRAGAIPDPQARERIFAASAAVFESQAPLLPFAEELLAQLGGSYRLVLLTKGDADVQRRRIATSHLGDYFEQVEIVSTKDTDTFRQILRRMGVAPSLSWSIGNSLPSDVAPALDAGMQSIWIDAHVWAHERRAHSVDLTNPRLHLAAGLGEVPKILAGLDRTS